MEGRTEPSLKVNCFYTDMKQLHLHWLKKSFMLYQCTVHGGVRFSVEGPRATDFFLTMSLWSSKSMFFFFLYKTPCISARLPWLMNVLCFCQGYRSKHQLLMVARRFAEYNIFFQLKVDISFPNYDQQRQFIISVQQKLLEICFQ